MAILTAATSAIRRLLDGLLLGLIVIVLAGVALGRLAPLAGRETLVVGGGSMEPALPRGAAVVVTPVDPNDLVVGDVVSLHAGPGRQVFTHRIVTIVEAPAGRRFETRGDANMAPDPTLVPADAIVGRVDWAIPLAGYLVTLLSLPLGVLFVIGLGCLLVAAAWLLETLELRRHGRRPRVLRRVPAERGLVTTGTRPAGRPLWASDGGPGPARRLATATPPGAVGTTPTPDGWRPAGASGVPEAWSAGPSPR